MGANEKHKVLVCPLEWGLGHAARCIPIIRKLLDNNFSVVAGVSSKYKEYYLPFFPELEYIDFPSIKINYGKNAFLSIVLQIPKFLFIIIYEHYYLRRIVKRHNFSFVISDNRYGVWNKKIKSIIISHQIFIKLPGQIAFLSGFLNFLVSRALLKFDECWIPDFPEKDNCFSGDLAHGKIPQNCRYIGLLSRFSKYKTENKEIKKQILVILSGPEPQRTIFEQIILKILSKIENKVFVIRGKPGLKDESYSYSQDNFVMVNHLNDPEFFKLLSESEYVICRAGYSTIMDLLSTGKNALLVPTPGQTEQEYLAKYLLQKERFTSINQQYFNTKNVTDYLNLNLKKFDKLENKLLKNVINDMRIKDE